MEGAIGHINLTYHHNKRVCNALDDSSNGVTISRSSISFFRSRAHNMEVVRANVDIFRNIRTMTHLDLSCKDLRDEGVRAVCSAVPESKLASLVLSNNGCGPDVAISIAAMVEFTDSLTNLDLMGTKLNDEGVDVIFKAMCRNEKGSMASLNLCDTNMGPAGGRSVAEMLPSLPSLTSVR